ncbi:hypothetical protein Pcinc_044015, partial [Petrolisthes cinctipes]
RGGAGRGGVGTYGPVELKEMGVGWGGGVAKQRVGDKGCGDPSSVKR